MYQTLFWNKYIFHWLVVFFWGERGKAAKKKNLTWNTFCSSCQNKKNTTEYILISVHHPWLIHEPTQVMHILLSGARGRWNYNVAWAEKNNNWIMCNASAFATADTLVFLVPVFLLTAHTTVWCVPAAMVHGFLFTVEALRMIDNFQN